VHPTFAKTPARAGWHRQALRLASGRHRKRNGKTHGPGHPPESGGARQTHIRNREKQYRRARFTTLRAKQRASPEKSPRGRENRHPELAKDLAWNVEAICFAALNVTVPYVRKPKRKRASLFSEPGFPARQTHAITIQL